MLVAAGVAEPQFTPLVRARISHVNGVPVDDYPAATPSAAATSSRTRPTSRGPPSCRADNELVSGEWWGEGADVPQISLEEELRAAIGLELGDEITYAIGGDSLTVRLTSTRLVHWDSFRPNFFMVLSPGAIERFAHTYITSLYVAPEQRRVTVDLVRQFPSVSVFDIGAVLDQVRRSMDRAALAVQYVFLFTLAAGVMVLLAAIQATRDERMFESAVLRTLGARRSVVLQGVAAEFTALGLLAGHARGRGRRRDRLRHRDAAVPARLRARASRCGSAASWRERSSSASAARSPCAPSSTIRRSPLCAAPERCRAVSCRAESRDMTA